LPARYVPPSGFGYPLDGFLPPGPCRPCFRPTALLGFTLRSIPLSQGIPRVTTGKHPRTVSPCTHPGYESRAAVPNRGSWALPPLRVPYDHRGFSTETAGCSPGFLPSRACQQTPRAGFRPLSSLALPRWTLIAATPRRPGVSIDVRLAPRSVLRGTTNHGTTLLGFLHRLDPEHSEASRPGYRFTSRRVAHHCRLADALGTAYASCRS
jgi:hypothetical protein